MTSTTNRSVLITGCSDGGIGSSLSLAFHQRGYHVFATSRNPEKNMSDIRDLPNITLLQLDVLDPNHIRAAVETVTAKTGGGGLSVLVNNAARFHYMPLLDDDIEAAKRTYETNVWGPLAVAKAFVPLLIKASGMLVNVTSIAGHNPVPYLGIYGSSKRSLEHISEVLRLELSPFHVKVLSVVTGAVATSSGPREDFVLPSGSRYRTIERKIAEGARGNKAHSKMPVTTFANQVVDQIEAGAVGKVWVGDHAEDARHASLNPEIGAQWEGFVSKSTGLGQLSEGSQCTLIY